MFVRPDNVKWDATHLHISLTSGKIQKNNNLLDWCQKIPINIFVINMLIYVTRDKKMAVGDTDFQFFSGMHL